MNTDKKISKRKFVGIVTSDKMDKTISVQVITVKRDPKYKKTYFISKKYKVHDETNQFKEGDKVEFIECRPLSKDKKWRVLAFDIKEYRRDTRDKLRKTLVSIGFERLQNSVWIYPYDCEDLIALAKADLRIGADVLYMIVERLEHDKHLREHFSLPAE